MQTSGKVTCFHFPECSMSYAKINLKRMYYILHLLLESVHMRLLVKKN